MMHFDESGKYVRSKGMLNSNLDLNTYHMSKYSNGACKKICLQYVGHRPSGGSRYDDGQSRCQVCDIYITVEGTKDEKGLFCKCCHYRVRNKPRNKVYKEKLRNKQENKPENEPAAFRDAHEPWIDTNEDYSNIDDNPIDKVLDTVSMDNDYSSEKKSAPVEEEFDESVKTFYELKEFLENNLKLQANYQLVMLKELVEYGENHKGEIAESLAYFNNKDTTNLNAVKYYFDVPVYDVLLNHGFVITTGTMYRRFPIYKLNVQLNESEKIRVEEIIANKLSEYNELNEIPENEWPNSDNRGSVVWNSKNIFEKFKPIIVEENSEKSQELTRLEREAESKSRWDLVPDNEINEELSEELSEDTSSWKKISNIVKKIHPTHSKWIWSVTPENWEILKSQNVWGSRISKVKIRDKVKPGDQVAFYVIGTSCFKGIFEFVGDWYDSPGKTWNDDLRPDGSLIHISQIQIKPTQLGSVKIHNLHEKLELFIDKSQNNRNLVLQGGSGYPSNNCRPLLEDDFTIIRTELMQNPDETPLNTKQNSHVSESIPTFAKTCPKCNVTQVIASLRQEFEEKIEESFGYRSPDPDNPDKKIPQSWCRQCRNLKASSNIESEIDITNDVEASNYVKEHRFSSNTEPEIIETKITSSDVADTKIFNFDDGEVNIQNCKILSTDTIKKDQILTNDEIMKLFKVGNMGGIRYTKYNNVIVLLSTHSDDYDDSIDLNSGFIVYTGEGKENQEFKNGNEKIRNSQDTPMVYFKEVYQEPGSRPRGALDNKYKFIGVVKYHKYNWATEKGRKVIKFVLEIVS